MAAVAAAPLARRFAREPEGQERIVDGAKYVAVLLAAVALASAARALLWRPHRLRRRGGAPGLDVFMGASWDAWERHPSGAEVVLCTAGELTLIQEIDGAEVRTKLTAGEYAINAPGVWHTADLEGPATAVFVTAGLGTEHRPRR